MTFMHAYSGSGESQPSGHRANCALLLAPWWMTCEHSNPSAAVLTGVRPLPTSSALVDGIGTGACHLVERRRIRRAACTCTDANNLSSSGQVSSSSVCGHIAVVGRSVVARRSNAWGATIFYE